ncbi:uncharacterized protein LOC128559875 [Mercenaria mercenaria]|uniref:uncharacterized protein LOC128559875 n=1 Tax=Mercenaria mercenaria TaxID=6596 RepID=UPI00234EB561|nr:uncharacterized protein LOC128559875 [Mercenaria mercenaria]
MAENTNQTGKGDNLSCLIQDTVLTLQENVKCEKAVKVQKAVTACIKFFLAELTKEEPLFKPAELIQVGSFAEGTKILEPDEFDFLVVIDELSKPGAVAVDNNPEKVKGYTHLPHSGYVTLAVADDNLKNKWEKYCENGLLQCFQNSIDRSRFGSIFIKVIRKLYVKRVFLKKADAVVTCTSTEIDFVNFGMGMPAVDDIGLNLRRVEFKTPNVLIDFKLDGMKISVDLSPAIRYYRITDCFKPEDCAGAALSDAILNRESLLLVANRNFDFRVTVTEAEVGYIQHIMKHEHKGIYIFLKYVNYLFETKRNAWEPYSSYMLKNICLMHDLNCQHETRTITSCFKDILEDMNACCSKLEITSAVNSKIDLCASSPLSSDKMTFGYRQHVVDALTKISQQAVDIHTFEDFKELLNSTVEKYLKRFQDRMDEHFYLRNDA